MPFSRAIFLYGEPIVVPRDANVEEWRVEIERRMNALADEADVILSRADGEGSGARKTT